MLKKMHHAVIDGMSGAEILGLLLDRTPEPRAVDVPARWGEADLVPGQVGMLARGVVGAARYPLRALRALPSALPNIDETPLRVIPGPTTLGRLASRAQRALTRQEPPARPHDRLVAPKTRFSGRLSAHRRFAFGQLSLADVKAANVPGPQFPLYCAGARLVANYPVSLITDGMGLNITVMSLDGHLDVGIVADREQIPDVARLVGWLGDELAELMPAAPKERPRRRAQAEPAPS